MLRVCHPDPSFRTKVPTALAAESAGCRQLSLSLCPPLSTAISWRELICPGSVPFLGTSPIQGLSIQGCKGLYPLCQRGAFLQHRPVAEPRPCETCRGLCSDYFSFSVALCLHFLTGIHPNITTQEISCTQIKASEPISQETCSVMGAELASLWRPLPPVYLHILRGS